MNTLLCAGGTGTRILEAVLHLCAAGLGPKDLRLLVIDPDSANGNGERVSRLVDSYREGHDRFGEKLGSELRLFGTKLDLLDTGAQAGVLKSWSPVKRNQRLRDVLNFDLLDSTAVPPDLVRLFFTQEELSMDLSQGFRGHPSVGAAAMSLVTLQTEEQPWRQLLEKLRGDLTGDSGARVFLVGSLFGGTGASSFFPLARFISDSIVTNRSRLKLGVGALTPYFRFEASTSRVTFQAERQAAKCENFPLATRSAVEFYEHLRLNGSWPFDVFYWIGDETPMSVEYAPGGPSQKNPAHFAELLGAFAALQFFQSPDSVSGSVYAASHDGGPAEERSLVEWRDLPLAVGERTHVREGLLRFFLAGIAHLGFCGPLLRRPELERSPDRVPWYWDRFASKEDRAHHLTTEENKKALDFLDVFFREYHFGWWREMHRHETVRLCNRVALGEDGSVRLDRLANLLWPDRQGDADPDAIDAFYTEMIRVPKSRGGEGGAATYLALLAHAADRFIAEHYKKTGIQE
jgi:hypothetical protein